MSGTVREKTSLPRELATFTSTLPEVGVRSFPSLRERTIPFTCTVSPGR